MCVNIYVCIHTYTDTYIPKYTINVFIYINIKENNLRAIKQPFAPEELQKENL